MPAKCAAPRATAHLSQEYRTPAWEQRKLGEVARRVTRKNENGDSDLPLTISAQYGLVDQRTFFNSQVASKDMSGYFLLHRGEFAYNKSTSTDSPWGAIKRLEKYDMGCVSTLYICFELLSGDPDFLVTYYETDRWYKSVQLIAAEGARNHGLLNIAPDDFFETQICIPKRIDEQRRIGAFFDRLDSLITLHQRKYDKLCVLKKSMLDKMFPKGGSLYPEIRFAGFTDPWEQCKFSELVDRVTVASNDPLLPQVEYEDINSGEGTLNKDLGKKDGGKTGILFEPGDILYGKLRPYLMNWLHPQFRGIAIGDFWVLRPSGAEGTCLYRLIQSDSFQRLADISSGSKMPRADWSLISSGEFLIPSDDAEQRRIGAFLDRLDSLITLHQRKLELLRNIKKSMLDKMFV